MFRRRAIIGAAEIPIPVITDTILTLSAPSQTSVTLNIYKTDATITEIYLNNTLETSSTTSGTQDISVTVPAGTSTIKISGGTFYFDSYCLGEGYSKNPLLTNVNLGTNYGSVIGGEAFRYSSITTITLPSSVTLIGGFAFDGCPNLTGIIIPAGITSVGNRAFSNCLNLASILVEVGNTVYDSRGGCNAIIETLTNKLVSGCKNTIIPNTVTSIGNNAFYVCGITGTLTIPNSVTSIGDSAFVGCSGLTSITIGNSVTSIGSLAFNSCSGLTEVTLPSSVTSIGMGAFSTCTGLTSVTINATTPPSLADSNAFSNTNNCPIYVPSASVTTYQSAANWSSLSSRIQAMQIIYGVKLDRTLNNNQPLGASWATYTDDAVGLSGAYMDFANDVFVDNGWYNRWPFNAIKPCIVKDGAVVGYLKKDNYAQYEDGTAAPITDRTAGNVMVEVPKIYYKISTDSQYNYIQISDKTFNGACCLAHVYKGQELSKIYVDAYVTASSDWQTNGPYSVSGIEPVGQDVTVSYASVYPTIKSKRGNRCEPMTFNFVTLMQCLFAIMFKSTNARNSLGSGISRYTENGVYTGVLNTKGFCYGENTYAQGDPNLGRIKFLGFEDFYGAKITFAAGVYFDSNGNYRVLNPYDSTLEYSPTGLDDFPIFSVDESLKPLPNQSDLIAIKLSGINSLGFWRTNKNTSETDVATTEDTNVGFCSPEKLTSSTNYKVIQFSQGFQANAGIFSMKTMSTANTTRRGFRIIYFPEET